MTGSEIRVLPRPPNKNHSHLMMGSDLPLPIGRQVPAGRDSSSPAPTKQKIIYKQSSSQGSGIFVGGALWYDININYWRDMLLAAHAISGGVIGEELNNPYLAFLAGFVFHFFLDFIPHMDFIVRRKWDWKQYLFVGSDSIIGILIILYFIHPQYSLNNPFWWGIFGGILPDLLDNVPFWQKAFRKTKFGHVLNQMHTKYHHSNAGPFWGILTQVGVIALSLIILSR